MVKRYSIATYIVKKKSFFVDIYDMDVMKPTIAPANTLSGIIESRRDQLKAQNEDLVERVTQEGQQLIMEVYTVAHEHRMKKPGPRFFSAEGKPPQNLTFITGKHIDVKA